MKRFLALREGQRIEILLEQDGGALVLETDALAPPYEAFKARRLPDQPKEALEQREEIREGGSRLVWDRGELVGEIEGEAFEVELRGQRLKGAYRIEDRGGAVKVSRGPAARRSRMPLLLLVFVLLAASIGGALFSPRVRAQVYLTLASEDEARISESGQGSRGWANDLADLGRDALPVLIPAVEDEARTDQSAFKRKLLLITAFRIQQERRPGAETGEEIPAAVLEGLAHCFGSRAFPLLRIQALNLLRDSGDPRGFALVIRHLRRLLEEDGALTFHAGPVDEAERAISALRLMASFNRDLLGQADNKARGNFRYHKPWESVARGLYERPKSGAPGLGTVPAPQGRMSIAELVPELEAWLASKPKDLPEQVELR